jgi:hypothetical protein
MTNPTINRVYPHRYRTDKWRNTASGIVKTLHELNVSAGDILVTANLFDPTRYIDLNGKAWESGKHRPVLVNADSILKVISIDAEGYITVALHPTGKQYTGMFYHDATYSAGEAIYKLSFLEERHEYDEDILVHRYSAGCSHIYHIPQEEKALISEVILAWEAQENLVQEANHKLPAVVGGINDSHAFEGAAFSLFLDYTDTIRKMRTATKRTTGRIKEEHEAALAELHRSYNKYKQYLGARNEWEKFQQAPVAPSGRSGGLAIPGGGTLHEGDHILTRFNAYKPISEGMYPTQPVSFLLAHLTTVDADKQEAVITFPDGDTATLCITPDGHGNITYEGLDYATLDPVTYMPGSTSEEAQQYIETKRRFESVRDELRETPSDTVQRHLRAGTPYIPELVKYLRALQTQSNATPELYEDAQQALEEHKDTLIANTGLPAWRSLWKGYQKTRKGIQEWAPNDIWEAGSAAFTD